jgi:hypothetical protein
MMAGGSIPLDPDAAAFLTAAGITTPSIIFAINTLVLDLKGFGLWTKMKAIYPFVGGTATTHKFNLKDPQDTNAAFRLSFVGGWTHSANGALPNGTNAYADTFFIPDTHFNGNTDIHVSYYSGTNSVGGNRIDMGVIQGSPTRTTDLTSSYSTLGAFTELSGATFLSFANTDTRGHYIGNRVGNEMRLVKNGVVQAQNLSSTPGGLPNINIRVGQRNNDHYSNRQCRLSSIGDGMSVTELSNYYTAVQAFQTTLSRQV